MMRLIIGSVGSSPLTRGTLTITTEQDETVSVHPRLRGELKEDEVRAKRDSGSSPLTRGTRRHGYGGATKNAVHPRLRGELTVQPASIRFLCGSSPLTRGTHLKWLQHYTNRLTAKLLKNISKQEQSY